MAEAKMIKCPNCCEELAFIRGMKQVYCGCCSSLLVNESAKNISYTDAAGIHPIALKAVKGDVGVVNHSGISDSESWREDTHKFLQVISAISYLTGSFYPVVLGKDWVRVDNVQNKMISLFASDDPDQWKEVRSISRTDVIETIDRYGLTVISKEKNENLRNYQTNDIKSLIPFAGDSKKKLVIEEYRYTVGITPECIRMFPRIKAVLDKAGDDPKIQEFMADVTEDEAEYINVSDSEAVMDEEHYSFADYGLADCSDSLHKCALTALIVSMMLKEYGDTHMLSSMLFGYGQDKHGFGEIFNRAYLKKIGHLSDKE